MGEAGLLFSPDDVSGFSAGLTSILNNPQIAEELKKKGLEQAKQFTWTKSVDRILSIINDEMPINCKILNLPKGTVIACSDSPRPLACGTRIQ